jgi:hypothetical protein
MPPPPARRFLAIRPGQTHRIVGQPIHARGVCSTELDLRPSRCLGACLAATLAVAFPACSSDDDAPSAPARPAVVCDTTVTSAAQLAKAAADDANRGRIVCAADGNYGTPTFEDISHPPGATVTLHARNPRRAVLEGAVLRNVSGLRIEGFRVTGGFENQQQPVSRVEIVGNDIGGGTSSGFILSCEVEDVLIEGNRIHDITATDEWWSGGGIILTGEAGCGVRRNVRIRHNTIERVQKDGMELGEVHGGEVVGNVFRRINTGPGDPDFHTDSLMIWANSEDLLVKDNRITDGNGVVVSGTRNIRFENNLVANIDNWCWQNGASGSTQAAPIDTTWVGNTVYDCGSDNDGGGFGGEYAFSVEGSDPSGNVLSRNVFSNLSGAATQFTASHNLIQNGPLPSSTDRRFTPAFADRTKWQPTNLPSGEDAGYHPVPAGHRAAP